MLAILLFPTMMPSLFTTPCAGNEVSMRMYADTIERTASDDRAAVQGWALSMISKRTSLHDMDELPAWIAETHAEVAGRVALLAGAEVIEAWRTYNGAGWLRCRIGAGREALIFQGRRGQFNQHSCGWVMDFIGAERVIVLTTDPERLPELLPGIPHEALPLPRPEDWASPEARAKVTYFTVGDKADPRSGYTTHRRGPAFPHPGGWTYQDVTGAHGDILYEGASEEEAQAALDTHQASFTGEPA